jgi:hypothetical protein
MSQSLSVGRFQLSHFVIKKVIGCSSVMRLLGWHGSLVIDITSMSHHTRERRITFEATVSSPLSEQLSKGMTQYHHDGASSFNIA